MTEEEAKTKWCPFARAGGPMGSEAQGVSYNRWPSSDGTMAAMLNECRHIKCIGSACMAWRWHGVLSNGRRHTSPEAYRAANDPSLSPSSGGMNEGDVRFGHCGLAGKP